MIHTIVYTYATEAAPLTSPYVNPVPGYKGPKTINVWAEVRKVLERTGDTFIWVVTTEQLNAFMVKMQGAGLEKYLKVRMDGPNQGTTNRNYPDRGRRLKVFIMKGVGQ